MLGRRRDVLGPGVVVAEDRTHLGQVRHHEAEAEET